VRRAAAAPALAPAANDCNCCCSAAVGASGDTVWVAWGAGAVLVHGPTGRAVRVTVAPRAASPSLATVRGATWMGAGRRAIRLRGDGRPGRVVRFGRGGSSAWTPRPRAASAGGA